MRPRLPNWPGRLERFVSDAADRRFRYGAFDCCLFVCEAIEAMTGTDPAREFRGRYSSRGAGRRLLLAAGGIPAIAAAHGMSEIPIGQARRGDVLMFKPMCIGLMALSGVDALVIGPDGALMRINAKLAKRAWRVG